jgi:hypothetical protein
MLRDRVYDILESTPAGGIAGSVFGVFIEVCDPALLPQQLGAVSPGASLAFSSPPSSSSTSPR